ncbi:WD40-repeat-containing domain protein [Fimicolochytrium jonesii]|uniref:WD40-repeat-containing domain protein n=1 Tax=Fimicolochytrium jonesii TaxID=1396493 RepID=UPI0022FE5CE4|nr:WD40-repeat-containing domain protein [Fimicolochytrium jonesii]KAI8816962.1 WD40-repeat-containing domain protein [Fimicolochytrium jonesii]
MPSCQHRRHRQANNRDKTRTPFFDPNPPTFQLPPNSHTKNDTPPKMDLFGQYGSDDEPSYAPVIPAKKQKINTAPEVSTQDLQTFNYIPEITTKEIAHNVPYKDLVRPSQGPENPFATQATAPNRNVLTGYVEEYAISSYNFDSMSRTFDNLGYAVDPNSNGEVFVGDLAKATATGGATIYETGNKVKAAEKRKRKAAGDPASIDGYAGPWAGYEGEHVHVEAGVGPTDEEIAAAEAASTQENVKKPKTADEEVGNERSIFHGKDERDYLGRTYMHVPTDLDVDLSAEPGIKDCFLPKTLIHTWTGHTKGVNAIRLFPNSAHLFLSAGMDNKVKLWDVYHDRRCLRTFMGHSKGVRDITFNNDGTRFLSASYDKYIKLWDTETGACISSYTTKRIPYCVRFNPDADKQHLFLTGCADKKIYQFDANSGEVVQEYDQHLGAVNTITFVDDNRRFVTTSDDKTLRAWEFDIPVVIKYVAEPSMHSMPAVTLHPTKKWLACQSLDNQIVIYSARDRFRLNRKKTFRGHLVAGYACQPSFSPDSRFVTSGDSEGRVWFWDWKTCKVLKKFKAHDKVVIGTEWHPHETSKLFTCSWDGTIKFWD